MFFSVDVETGNTKTVPGALLSIGAVAITEDLQMGEQFYCNLAYDVKSFDEKTMEWWADREKVCEEAMFQALSWTENRLHPFSAAVKFADWVVTQKNDEEAYFVANPASFDHAWIMLLFNMAVVENPFSHRTICLRSLRFGITGGVWGKSRGTDPGYSEIDPCHNTLPHHALADAIAQGGDFVKLMQYIKDDHE